MFKTSRKTLLISTAAAAALIGPVGFAIVAGGLVAAAALSFPAADIRAALKTVRDLLRDTPDTEATLRHDVRDILHWAQLVKEKGLRGLEKNMGPSAEDPLVGFGLTLVVSDYEPEDVRTMMQTVTTSHNSRETAPLKVLQSMIDTAPALGAAGALASLIVALPLFGGHAAAVAFALIPAFYGILAARLVLQPAAARFSRRLEAEKRRNKLLTEGMVMLAAQRPSLYVQDRLNSFLAPEAHDSIDVMLHDRALLKFKEFRA